MAICSFLLVTSLILIYLLTAFSSRYSLTSLANLINIFSLASCACLIAVLLADYSRARCTLTILALRLDSLGSRGDWVSLCLPLTLCLHRECSIWRKSLKCDWICFRWSLNLRSCSLGFSCTFSTAANELRGLCTRSCGRRPSFMNASCVNWFEMSTPFFCSESTVLGSRFSKLDLCFERTVASAAVIWRRN